MTISSRIDFSHKYSYKERTRGVFRIMLVPERMATATGFHYIVLVDNSGPMRGEKLETAKSGAIELLKRIPEGNKATLIVFSSYVEVLDEYKDPGSLIDTVSSTGTGGLTSMYSALIEAIRIAMRYGPPGYIVLLTDGIPTDVPFKEPYEDLELPPGFKVIAFGIGQAYNEGLLKALADRSGGVLNHISDFTEVGNALPQAAVTQVGAKDVRT
ncbi:vWA domain-containing protein [Stygiolobus caldivivus]|uniref:VWFA domain-containing protein n=1 Tax=Stygiolobus caldivivus TaxID=2824673 RepID=A0A8D5U6V8_9CREN|nr:vWA domain-containing protein [Stygiolobus caldivivus]BCU70087.1 hypothetical protein KN1_13840 [Stygiolobus caldivivus]